MKARPFLAVLLALGLLALSLGGAGWWLVWHRGPLALQQRPLSLPRAARFVPRQAPLSLYLLTDGNEPVAYARAVAPARSRRQAADAIERLRDGAFAAAGLDYRDELASWLAPELGLAFFDLPAPAPAAASPKAATWLLALRSRDGDGARRFVQRFWQTRSLAGTDLQVTRYRGMGLISGRGALVGRQPLPLATALVDDDLLLIASGRGVLEQALDVSQIDELNQGADPLLRQGLDRLGAGVAVVVARSSGLASGLGLGADQGADAQLLASLRPEGASVWLEGLLRRGVAADSPPPSYGPAPPVAADASLDAAPNAALGAAPEAPRGAAPSPVAPFAAEPLAAAAGPQQRRTLLAAAPAASERLALLDNPAALLHDPLVRSLLERIVAPLPAAGPLPPLLLAAADGPLMVADAPVGWLIASPLDQPTPAALEAPLAAAGLIPAPLELDGRSVTVWTRLEAAGGRGSRPDRQGVDRLQAPLQGWRGDQAGLALWGRSLALLEGAELGRGAQRRERQLNALHLPNAPIQWALGAEPARQLLAEWLPWRRLTALAGGPLDGPLRGLALGLEPDGQALRLRGRLELGAAG
jgi:hypothetical protein